MEIALGEEDSLELAWLTYEKGIILNNLFQYDKAKAELEKSLDMFRRVSPESYDFSFVAKSVVRNSHKLYHITEDTTYLEKAKKLLQESDIAFCKSISNSTTRYGSYIMTARHNSQTSNQAQKARSLVCWAENAYYFKEYEKAIKLGEESYKILYSIFGENETDVHFSMMIMAKAYSKIKQFDQAISLIRKTIKSRKLIWGCYSDRYWRYVEHYADICYENGKLQECLNQLYEIKNLMHGMEDSHPHYYDYINIKIDKISAEIKG